MDRLETEDWRLKTGDWGLIIKKPILYEIPEFQKIEIPDLHA